MSEDALDVVVGSGDDDGMDRGRVQLGHSRANWRSSRGRNFPRPKYVCFLLDKVGRKAAFPRSLVEYPRFNASRSFYALCYFWLLREMNCFVRKQRTVSWISLAKLGLNILWSHNVVLGEIRFASSWFIIPLFPFLLFDDRKESYFWPSQRINFAALCTFLRRFSFFYNLLLCPCNIFLCGKWEGKTFLVSSTQNMEKLFPFRKWEEFQLF